MKREKKSAYEAKNAGPLSLGITTATQTCYVANDYTL